MEITSWNSFLFAGKWAFIGLIYFTLFVVLIAVRREMSQRIESKTPGESNALGRLKVLQAGSDASKRLGALLALKPDTRLGAAADNDLVLGDRYVSGHHARLYWDGATWWLEDLGSTNGTRLNDESLPPHTPAPVASGAILQIGDMTFELLVS